MRQKGYALGNYDDKYDDFISSLWCQLSTRRNPLPIHCIKAVYIQ